MGIFGWSYPPGCSGTPFDEDHPCEVCHGADINPEKATEKNPACICEECLACGQIGDPNCYKPVIEGGHGLVMSEAQKSQHDRMAKQWEEDARAEADGMAKAYEEEKLS